MYYRVDLYSNLKLFWKWVHFLKSERQNHNNFALSKAIFSFRPQTNKNIISVPPWGQGGSLYFCVRLKTSIIKWKSNTDNNKVTGEQNMKSYFFIKCLLGNSGVAKLLVIMVE